MKTELSYGRVLFVLIVAMGLASLARAADATDVDHLKGAVEGKFSQKPDRPEAEDTQPVSYQPAPNRSQVGVTLARRLSTTVSQISGGWIYLANGYVCDYRPITALDAYGRSRCYLASTDQFLETYCISAALLGGYSAWRCDAR